MKMTFDHDLHIHSQLSLCSSDPEQTTERLLRYAKDNALRTICLTDHFWDSAVPGASDWYKKQNMEHISAALPLPDDSEVKFLFGCETDMRREGTVGVSRECFDNFDFIIIPTTHLHMRGFTIAERDADSDKRRAELWGERMDKLLAMDLPFHKIGIAHPVCYLFNNASRERYLASLDMIPDAVFERVFAKAREVGCGIELNQSDMSFDEREADTVLRPFKVAKSCGCRFYFGSDAHHPSDFADVKEIFERAVSKLDLTENDKFYLQ